MLYVKVSSTVIDVVVVSIIIIIIITFLVVFVVVAFVITRREIKVFNRFKIFLYRKVYTPVLNIIYLTF